VGNSFLLNTSYGFNRVPCKEGPKLHAPEAIKFNGQPWLELDDLWQALHSMFNTAQHRHIESDVLNELGSYLSLPWAQFAEEEFTSSLLKYSNISTPGPNKLL